MTFEENKTASEVAEILNIPIGSVYGYKSQYKLKHNVAVERNYEVMGKMFIDEDLPVEEIAKRTNKNLGTVRKYINKYKRENGLAKERTDAKAVNGKFKKEWDRVRFILNPNARRETE